MPPRSHIQVPFGGGLDRETGQLAVKPTSMQDLRNVILHKGKAVAREGAASTLQFNDTNGDPTTHILSGQTILGSRTAAIVAYQGDDTATKAGEVSIHLMDAEATEQRLLGEWFTVSDPANEDPPIVLTTEVNGKVFFAHDEYNFQQRADTYVYDPFEGEELRALRVQPGWPLYPTNDEGDPVEDPDPANVPTIKFRGVTHHLEYLVGWGFGTNEEDRAEIVRVSLAGEPTVFDVQHYFQLGARNDPTIACTTVGGDPGILKVFKEVETYDIVGDAPQNFGEWTADEHFGCMAPRLAVTVNGVAFFWSDMGPRMVAGRGPSQEIGLPLDLEGFEPSDLPARDEIERGWANYIPEARVVVFAFNRRLYTLSVREGTPASWSYWTLGFDQMSGFQIYNTGIGADSGGVPTTQVDWKHQEERGVGPGADTDTYKKHKATLVWTQSGHQGDEMVEIWKNKVPNLISNWELDQDSDSDGVADGWVSNTDSGISASFTAPVQHIEITGSTSAGEAHVSKEIDGLSPDDEVNISVECKIVSASGTFEGRLYGEWLDSGGSVLATTAVTSFTQTDSRRRYVLDETAPSNTAKLRIVLAAAAPASGDTGEVEFENALAYRKANESGWGRHVAVQISPQNEQSYELGLQEELEEASFYEVAFRLKRGINIQGGGYGGSDPDAWPDISKGLAKTGTDSPLVRVPFWRRSASTDEGMLVDIELSKSLYNRIKDALDDFENAGIRIYRDDGSGFANVDEITSLTDFEKAQTIVPGSDEEIWLLDDYYENNSVPGEQDVTYQATAFIEGDETDPSEPRSNWTGPPRVFPPLGSSEDLVTLPAWSPNAGELKVEWARSSAEYNPPVDWWNEADVTILYEVEYKNVTAGGAWTAFASSPTDGGGDALVGQATETGLNTGDEYKARVRTKSTVFGTDDWSEWAESETITVS